MTAAAAVGCGGGGLKGPPAMDAAADTAMDVPIEPDAPAGSDAADTAPVTPLEHVVSVFPAPDATAVCTDAPLRMVFDAPPTLGTAGWVRVFAVGNPTPVDSFDLGAITPTQIIGGMGARNYFYRPITITGNEAYIYLRKVLKPGVTYYVNIDPGVFTAGAGGAPIGAVTDATSGRFTVRAAPAAGASQIAVAADGAGDFCTVQGAIDYIPAGNTTPVTITLAVGTYREIVAIQSKHNLTVRGEDRTGSVISYANSAALQTPPGTTTSAGTKFRAMFGIDTSNDIVIENITLWNPSPQLSSNGQSETLRSESSNRIIVRNATIRGLQDTLLLSGQVYIADSRIDGNVDFIWGAGVVYFDRCEIKDVARKGYNVQARNGSGAFGYTFVDCNLTSDPGITGHFLARTDKNNTMPSSQVAYVNCTMGSHIDPVGWLIDGYARPVGDAGAPDGGPNWNLAGLRFAEYRSVDPVGSLIDVSQRIPEAKQLTDAEAAQLRDPAYVFGGWNPKATPSDAGTD